MPVILKLATSFGFFITFEPLEEPCWLTRSQPPPLSLPNILVSWETMRAPPKLTIFNHVCYPVTSYFLLIFHSFCPPWETIFAHPKPSTPLELFRHFGFLGQHARSPETNHFQPCLLPRNRLLPFSFFIHVAPWRAMLAHPKPTTSLEALRHFAFLGNHACSPEIDHVQLCVIQRNQILHLNVFMHLAPLGSHVCSPETNHFS